TLCKLRICWGPAMSDSDIRTGNANRRTSGVPITPSQAEASKTGSIPSFVIDAVNELLSAVGRRATLQQKDVIAAILRHAPEGTPKKELFEKHWPHSDPVSRPAGGNVKYDKPA